MFLFLTALASAALKVGLNEEKAFLGWMRDNGVAYTGDEYHMRFGIWMTNVRYVSEHNKMGTWQLAVNSLSALTPAEYASMLGFTGHPEETDDPLSAFDPPDELDWRTKGVVNPIKDQGRCGSCWAFSCIQAGESAWAIKNKKLEAFSEKNIVDCAHPHCWGCHGGSAGAAYDYIIKSQGGKYMLQSDYPYHPSRDACQWNASKGVGQLTKTIGVKQANEPDLAAKVAEYGPASIAIDASHNSFQHFHKGIYNETACSQWNLDHGVGCVGWGVENSVKYWLVRNSWGTRWGDGGYIKIARGHNRCGVASLAIVCIP
jgi:cathepsin L